MKLVLLFALLAVGAYARHGVPNPQIIAVSPYRIRRGYPFEVTVRRIGERKRLTVNVSIVGTTEDGAPFKVRKSVYLKRSKSSGKVTFETGRIGPGLYFLVIESDNYQEEKKLVYAVTEATFFYQFDKPVYAPQQLVKARVFAIDSETNSKQPNGDVQIVVSDSNGKSVIKFRDLEFINGKYEFTYKLPADAPLGYYMVRVFQNGINLSAGPFEVRPYEFEPYEISTSLYNPSTFEIKTYPLSIGRIPVTIFAEYTNGAKNLISGEGIFTINGLLQRNFTVVDGLGYFEIDIADDLGVDNIGSIDFNVVFRDDNLGYEKSINGYFYIYPNTYFIRIEGDRETFPGAKFRYSIEMKDHEGLPPPEGTLVKIHFKPQNTKQYLYTDEDGRASSYIIVPASVTSYLFVTAEADDAIAKEFESLIPFVGDGPYITLSEPEFRFDVRSKVTITVGQDVESAFYIITARGLIVKSDQVYFKRGKRSASFYVTPDYDFAPFFDIVAYFVTNSGVIVARSKSFGFERPFLTNFVTLKYEANDIVPGKQYTFYVESKCGSTVSLSASDRRLVNLAYGNTGSPTRGEVFYSLNAYAWNDLFEFDPRQFYNLFDYTFIYSGAFVFSSYKPHSYEEEPPRPVPIDVRPASAVAARTAAPLNQTVDSSRPGYTPDSFCWIDVNTRRGSSSSSSEEHDFCYGKARCTVPNYGRYNIYAVSMNDYYGTGVEVYPLDIPFPVIDRD